MALIFIDGFDHYGVTANMTEGAWAEISSGQMPLSTTNPRTGTTCIRGSSNTSTRVMRRVLGSAKTTVGMAGAFYLSQLPSANNAYTLYDFRDAANAIQISIVVQSTGTISAIRGGNNGTVIGTSASTAITAEAYQHVETVVFFSQTVGTVEVRVNGVTYLSLTGVDTVASSNVECSQVGYVCGNNASTTAFGVTTDMDDIFVYDNTGSYNNTFIGDRRVLTLYPNADTIQADWTAVGSATGFGAIDETNPDADTTYIVATTTSSPSPISEFGIENLPGGISAISGVVLVHMERKTEAGVANIQASIISGSSETAGTNNAITEIYTYRQDVFETDPSSAAPFTTTQVDALKIKFERTA